MSEDLLVRHCSPTLAGIKTGNLFSCPCTSRADLTKELCRLNKKLVPKGIRVLPLRVCGGRALIYVYRPHALECDLANQRARALLLKYGYTPENPNCCVVHLMRRLCAEEFPHEIGVFLGYPIEDIYGFLYHKEEGCLLVGEWRVYSDEENAKKMFLRFKKCRAALLKRVNAGNTLAQIFCAA